MAQVVGFDRHVWMVNSFRRSLASIREELIEIADQCATSSATPEQTFELEVVFAFLLEYTLPVKKSLVPIGFPVPELLDVGAMLVASDFWEERGETTKSLELRDRA